MDRDKALTHFAQVVYKSLTADEEAMYGPMEVALQQLCPSGTRVVTLKSGSSKKPDMHFEDDDGGLLAYIEVKKPSTVADAFRVPAEKSSHQIDNYRNLEDPAVILLTDGVRWWDVTSEDDVAPFATMDPSSGAVDANLRTLADRLSVISGTRPRYRSAQAAATGMQSVIGTFDAQAGGEVSEGWNIVRQGLGLNLESASTLDTAGPGEVVAFSLLALAVSLPPLQDSNFVDAAKSEWTAQQKWSGSALPATLRQTFRAFRSHAAESGSVPEETWVTIRAIARWIAHQDKTVMWTRLSSLWDTYLHTTGRRERLGSWQTPRAVADLQARQVAEALVGLGYGGLADPKVTVIDPCVGTGVYLDAVVSRILEEGGHPVGVNPSEAHPYSRIVGVDVSSTAVATTLLRLAAQDVHPNLYLADTLSTGARGQTALFESESFNAIVAAAQSDHDAVDRWSRRDSGSNRPPVLAVIGNPPYQRSGLKLERYKKAGWRTDVHENWRVGSGGRGGLQDPFVAFWAWAFNLCDQAHPDVPDRPFGVVSFITNRSWIDGDTFKTMRSWTSLRAANITVVDFGPGSRGGGGGRWSDQPFAIESGTAIVTVVFDPSQPTTDEVVYRKARWETGIIVTETAENVTIKRTPSHQGKRHFTTETPWTPQVDHRSLLEGVVAVNGVKATPTDRWVRVVGDRDFGMRHAYRAFDNRWSPTVPPPKAKRGAEPEPREASAYAEWGRPKLFDPHPLHAASGGWYAIMQAKPTKPGPAVKPTRHLPDYDFFKGSEGGKVVRVKADAPIPDAYRDWAKKHKLDGNAFWLYVVAAAHHRGYWTDGHPYALQLADQRIEPPLTDDPATVVALVKLGTRLLELWSLDDVEAVVEPYKSVPGEPEAEQITIHGRPVLARWRKGRPKRDGWDRKTLEEYARTVAAVREVAAISDQVAELLDKASSKQPVAGQSAPDGEALATAAEGAADYNH